MNSKLWIAALAVPVLAACGEEEGRRVPLGQDTAQSEGRASWPEVMVARVDSANLAYSEGRYEEAAEIYRGLTEAHPEIGTVWFGLYMAENALGNAEAARAALERAESMAPGLGQMHEAAESGSMERMESMPEGHPPAVPEGHPPLDSAGPEAAPPLPSGGR